MSWDECAKTVEGNWVKIPEGGTLEVRFTGDPKMETKHFVGGSVSICEGDGCKLCATGDEASVSYVLPVVVYPDGDAKTLTLSRRAFKDLLPVRERLGAAFDRTKIVCSRRGVGKNIQYGFVPNGPADSDPIPF